MELLTAKTVVMNSIAQEHVSKAHFTYASLLCGYLVMHAYILSISIL